MNEWSYSALMPTSQRRRAIKARLKIYPLKNVYEQLNYHEQMHRGGSKYENRVKADIDWLANYLYKKGEIKDLTDLATLNKVVEGKREKKLKN